MEFRDGYFGRVRKPSAQRLVFENRGEPASLDPQFAQTTGEGNIADTLFDCITARCRHRHSLRTQSGSHPLHFIPARTSASDSGHVRIGLYLPPAFSGNPGRTSGHLPRDTGLKLLNGPPLSQQSHRFPLSRAAKQQRISQGSALNRLTRALVVPRKLHANGEIGAAFNQ